MEIVEMRECRSHDPFQKWLFNPALKVNSVVDEAIEEAFRKARAASANLSNDNAQAEQQAKENESKAERSDL